MATLTHNLGFPRTGARCELKPAVESFLAGRISESELAARSAVIRERNWLQQKQAGVGLVPSNDFSYFDQMLDMAMLLGAVPERFRAAGAATGLDTYFAMTRGRHDGNVPPLERARWFDTNYYHLVPELKSTQEFTIGSTKPFDEFREALALGITTKPVLIGPVTFLMLSNIAHIRHRQENLRLLPGLVPVYGGVLKYLHMLGVEWVQMDEPVLVTDLDAEARRLFLKAYRDLKRLVPEVKLLLATYFGELGNNLATAVAAPVDALHIDLSSAPAQIEAVLEQLPESMRLSAGIVDGRNVWANDIQASLALLTRIKDNLGSERLLLAPSCSLLHCPLTLAGEKTLARSLKARLAFGVEKLHEINVLSRALAGAGKASTAGKKAPAPWSAEGEGADLAVEERCRRLGPRDFNRHAIWSQRRRLQQEKLALPLLPTTLIGFLPRLLENPDALPAGSQTQGTGKGSDTLLASEIEQVIRLQEEAGMDVLVCPSERADPLEHLSGHLAGCALTSHGWIQSFGTNYVRPPIIYADVSRTGPVMVRWAAYAQSRTSRPVKCVLPGPLTVLQHSFVHDSKPHSKICLQIALAIRDELQDLEASGIRVLEINEPGLAEAMPLRAASRPEYLTWAVDALRLITAGAGDTTQVHIHLCRGELEHLCDTLGALNADVISLEASPAKEVHLDCFRNIEYDGGVGPGVWDVGRTAIPSVQALVVLLKEALFTLTPEQLWVNPDCGLQRLSVQEALPGMHSLVEAARLVRESLDTGD